MSGSGPGGGGDGVYGMRVGIVSSRGMTASTATPGPQQFNVVKVRETMRGWLAAGVLLLFALEIVSFFGLAFSHVIAMQDIKELGLLLFTPTIGVLGTVLGFYFGADKAAGSETT